MPRRFNYTKRKRISAGDFSIQLNQDGGGLSFEAHLNLASYDLDSHARVFVEAYKSVSTIWRRFDFGRVGAMVPPANRSLNEFGNAEGIRFRIKVASDGNDTGKLLAEADRITPRLPGDTSEIPRKPLLSTEPGDIADEIWRVDFEDEPSLVINRKIEDWKGLATSSIFQAIALPSVLRQLLTRVLLIDRLDKEEDDPDEWRTRWITFAESLPGVRNCPGPLEDQDENKADIEDWINECAEAFSSRTGSLATLLKWQNGEGAS